ncbi:MAG: hypothetical protein Hens3KO_23540 [Henriciella sp.]
MSRKTIYSYRDLEAERRRAEEREINRLMGELTKLSKLERNRAKYEPNAAQDATETLEKFKSNRQALSRTERRQWLSNVEDKTTKLQQDIANAEAQRLRLEMTASMLASRSNAADASELKAISKSARALDAQAFQVARSTVEAIVTSRMMRGASEAPKYPVSEERRSLAAKLLGPEPQQTFISASAGPETEIIDRLIADLVILGADADPLIERATALVSDAGSHSLDMKLDSLRLDAAELRAKHLVQEEVERLKQDAETILAPYDDPAASAIRRQVSTLALDDIPAARATRQEAQDYASKQDQSEDAQKARAALVHGLQQLGYEVRLQGEEWEEGERITISQPSEPHYDVELMSPPGGKIQSKVRAYMHDGRSETTNTRDVEVESQWCENLRTLNAALEHEGLNASLAHEDKPGSGEPHFAETEFKTRTEFEKSIQQKRI